MEKEELYESLFTLIPEGMFSDADELGELIEDEGLEAVYPLIPEGMFEDEKEFLLTFQGEKKNDLPSTGPTPSTESPIEQPVETGEENIFNVDYGAGNQTVDSQVDNQVDYGAVIRQESFDVQNPVGTKFGANTQVGEKNTWLEEVAGKNEITDFFGDIYRAGAQGVAQGGTIDDARRLFTSGGSATKEDIAKYITAVENMDNYGMSDEMKSFNKIYEANGGGVLGFVKGVAVNPTVIGQLFISSVASMVNPDVVAAAGAGAATGAAIGGGIGAAAGSIGTPIGSAIAGTIGAGSGAVTGSLLAASGTLETGLAFTEFLKEEIEKRGLEFNNESIAKVLNTPQALTSIRNKSIARGLVIGTVDAFTRGIAGKLGGSTIKAAKAAKKTVTGGMKARAGLKAAGIEAVGGSTGEAAARAVTGQEQDTAEILFEGVTGQASSLLSVPQAISGNSLTDMGRNLVGKGKDIFKPSSYGYITKKGSKMLMSKADVESSIDTMTDQEIMDSNFVIENDTDLQNKYRNRQQDAVNNMEAPGSLIGEQRKIYLELLKERDNMENPDTPKNKKRLAEINTSLDQLISDAELNLTEEVEITQEDGTVVKEKIGVTQKEAIDALNKEGIEKPTDDQVKDKQNELLKFAIEAAKKTADNFIGSRNVKNLSDEEAEKLATDELVSEGIVNPTEQQINERKNAIQESSAAQVDVSESTDNSTTVGEGDTAGVITDQSETENSSVEKPIETQTQEEISVNVAPFFETSIENTAEAGGLRKSPQYQKYKNGLTDLAKDLGIEVEVDESVGGYVNEAGTKVREVSNVVKLKNATLEQASEYAALAAALAPEVQESSIAAEYTVDNAENHNGNELTIKVSDSEGTFQALQEAGIDEYTLNETNNSLTLLDIFDFSDPESDTKLENLIRILEEKNITYELTDKKAINSRFIDKASRQQILSDGRLKAIQQQQEGSSLYKKIISAINRDAQKQGISPNEYIGSKTAPEVTADSGRVQKIIDGIIKKTEQREQTRDDGGKTKKQRRDNKKQTLLKNALEYLQNSKLYQELNDTERNQLVRDLNEKLGIKIKKPPSVKKILGKPKDKKVLVNERTEWLRLIKTLARQGRRSFTENKIARNQIVAEIVAFGKTLGKISLPKITAIIKRFANVNINSKKSVNNFTKYIENVFTKVDYLQRLNDAKKFAKKAKKQIGGAKTGVLPPGLKTALETLFSVNVNLVPENKLDAYLELAQEYGSSKKVLDLKSAEETLPKVLDVLDAIAENVNADLAGIKAEKITADFDVDGEVESISMQQKQISNSDLNNIPNPRARDNARVLSKLTPEQILSLAKEKKDGTMDYSNIILLNQVLSNIKNGYAGKAVTDLVTRLNVVESAAAINPKIKGLSFKKITTGITDIYSKIKSGLTKRGSVTERIRNLSTFFVDDVLGNFNSKLIYNNTFGKLARSYETYKAKVAKIEALVDGANSLLNSDGKRLAKFLGISRNALVKKKYKLRMLQLQREHQSNTVDGKPNAKAPSAMAFINATVKSIVKGEILSQQDADVLNELKAEFEVDGEINLEKLEQSLTAKEKKALALYDEANGSLSSEAEFISANLHGNKINLLNDYNHHAVLQSKDGDTSTILDKLKRFQNLLSTKSGTIVERTNGAKPISFDPGYSATRGAQETFLDYEMTQSMREVDGTINELETQMENEGTKDSLKGVRALKSAKDEIVRVIFKSSFSDMSKGSVLNLKIQKLGYQAALGSLPRAVAEIAGNLFVMSTNPKLALRAFKQFGTFVMNPKNVNEAVDAMTALESSQTTKMFDTDALSSKHSQMVEYGGKSSKSGTAVSRMENLFGQLLKYTGVKSLSTLTDKAASKIITFPDQMMSRPLWFGSWATAFEAQIKKTTGKTIKITPADFKKIADGTSEYLSAEYKDARANATAQADAKTITLATSKNPFDSIIKNMRNADDGTRMALYKMANSYMASFSLYEYGTARNAILAMFKKGDMSKIEAAALLTGVTMRMSSYMVVYGMLTSLLDDELFDADDYKDEEVEDVMARQMIGSVLTLISRGSLGNLPNIPLTFALEYGINEPLLGDLRENKEYDPFYHSIVFSLINKEDLSGPPEEMFTEIMAGPYGPAMRTLFRMITLGARATQSKQASTRKKAEDELLERMTVEVMGNLGLLPFYKDIRRILLKKRFAKNPNILTPDQRKRLIEQGILEDNNDTFEQDTFEQDTFEQDTFEQ